ncbi:MAG: hypothetical protein FWH27_00365 [Planctomycetaceae bacterium]|nr:hypothetical protein [Planctomycetaceae bacterium]
MPSPRVTFFEDIQVVPQYEQLRNALLQEQYALHLTKPLAFWTLPTDRRLPLILINRTLGELLQIPFDELCRTPSIGEKKIQSFITLLTRAVNTNVEDIPDSALPLKADSSSTLFLEENDSFTDSTFVSEIQWQKWQAVILEKGLANEKLGRLCPSLSELTRVIWNNTLGDYCDKTLVEMREIRTHGEKRVTAILKIFHCVCAIVNKVENSKHLIARLVPKDIDRVETWSLQVLNKRGTPHKADIEANYIRPLLEQLKIDATEQICRLAENRIGLQGEVTSIRQAARALGLARARIYQLLNEINDILMVRWPYGRLITSLLRNKFLYEAKERQHNDPEFARFHAAAELFFPWGRREDADDDYFFQFMNMSEELANGYEDEPSRLEEETLVAPKKTGRDAWDDDADRDGKLSLPAR